MRMISEEFRRKVVTYGIVDTKIFRYRYDSSTGKIWRLPLVLLDTTAAYTWQEVK